MKYTCDLCGLTSGDAEKVHLCEGHGSAARFVVKQEVLFVCQILGVRMELRGVIKEVILIPQKRQASYRILVGNDPRLKHQNCIYGGIPDKNILRRVK